MELGPVRVAVANQVEIAAVDGGSKQADVVAMDERDPAAAECDVAKTLVAGQTGHFDRSPQLVFVMVAVAEYEMRWPPSQCRRNIGGADVAAVQHGFDLERLKHADRSEGVQQVPVRVAYDAN